MPTSSQPKALLFDVFGTVVDWRGSIIREGRALAAEKKLDLDCVAFADAWRAGYRPAMDRVRRGDLPWMNIDALHRLILDEILSRFGIHTLEEAEKDQLNRVWHRLKPWPDAVRGLRELKKNRIIATLSNGNVALLTNMAKHAGLPWDCIFSAELFHHYKPDPETYLGAAGLLGLEGRRGDDGRRARGRSGRRPEGGTAHRLRAPATRVRRPPRAPAAAGSLRLRRAGLRRPGQPAGHPLRSRVVQRMVVRRSAGGASARGALHGTRLPPAARHLSAWLSRDHGCGNGDWRLPCMHIRLPCSKRLRPVIAGRPACGQRLRLRPAGAPPCGADRIGPVRLRDRSAVTTRR